MKKPNLKANLSELKASGLSVEGLSGSGAGKSLIAGVAAVGLLFGVAELRPPVDPAKAAQGGAATMAPVQRTQAVCPDPRQGLLGTTNLTMYSPGGGSTTDGTATLNNVAPSAAAPAPAPASSSSASAAPSGGAAPAPAQAPAAKLSLAKTGVPATGAADNGPEAPGTFAVANGAYAPGFSVTQVTSITDPKNPSLSGVECAGSGTDFWFAGASTSGSTRVDYISLVNADSQAATVDIHLFGPKGPIDVDTANGITLGPGTTQWIRLKTITDGVDDLAIHVVARSGRVGAYAHAEDQGKGGDWIPASVAPAPSVIIPGLPGDLDSAHLVVAAPGQDDADLKIQVSGKNGWFTPAGNESIHVKAGMVAAVDLTAVTKGEAGALRLTPSDSAHQTPVIAGVRVNRSKNGKSEAAWLSGAGPVGARASVADNRAGSTNLYLTAGNAAATVKVTSSAGSGGGTPATKEVQIPAGATVSVDNPDPAGLNGVYALTVETENGGPVVAARMLTVMNKDVQMFTIQQFSDDHSTVRVPHTGDDPGMLVRNP